MEQTFVMIKPDGVQRNLVGMVISRLEARGYRLAGLKLMQIDQELAGRHYAEHAGKPFFDGLVSYITSGPVVAMVWEGKNAVSGIRKMIGATNPQEADPGTIRGDFGLDIGRNVIHGSDSQENAQREIALYFEPAELLDYDKILDQWLYE